MQILLIGKGKSNELLKKELEKNNNVTFAIEDYEKIEKLPDDADFFSYQKMLIGDVDTVPSHNVIERHIQLCGKDYRYETAPNPVDALRDRFYDNTSVGRVKNAAFSTEFRCNK